MQEQNKLQAELLAVKAELDSLPTQMSQSSQRTNATSTTEEAYLLKGAGAFRTEPLWASKGRFKDMKLTAPWKKYSNPTLKIDPSYHKTVKKIVKDPSQAVGVGGLLELWKKVGKAACVNCLSCITLS